MTQTRQLLGYCIAYSLLLFKAMQTMRRRSETQISSVEGPPFAPFDTSFVNCSQLKRNLKHKQNEFDFV